MTDRFEGAEGHVSLAAAHLAARRNGDHVTPSDVDHRQLEADLRGTVVETLGSETARRAAESKPPLTGMDRRRLVGCRETFRR